MPADRNRRGRARRLPGIWLAGVLGCALLIGIAIVASLPGTRAVAPTPEDDPNLSDFVLPAQVGHESEAAAASTAPGDAGRPWRPPEGEVYPNAKRLAAAVAQHLATYPQGSTAEGVAAATAARFGVRPTKLRSAAAELVRPGVTSSASVVYPQLGGLTPTAAAVMVVVHQRLIGSAEEVVEARTFDVRLRLDAGEWTLVGVSSAGGTAAQRPDQLPPAAVAVLDHPAIQLTESAAWDIYNGNVAPELLLLMARIGDRYEIGVTTLATGHPSNVFATDRQSNHTRGRAVDIFSVDGQPVVSQRERGTAAHRLTRWLFRRGVPELGTPWALDDAPGGSFTDAVHLDHLHVAI